jgi:hypothetical protein
MTRPHKFGIFQGNGVVQGKPSAICPSKRRDDLHEALQLSPTRAVARQVTPRKDTGLRSDSSSEKISHPLKKWTKLFQDDTTNQTVEEQVDVVDTDRKRGACFSIRKSSRKSQGGGWSQADTQEVEYDACFQVQEQDRHQFFLHDAYGYQVIPVQEKMYFLIGRRPE